MLKRAIPSFAAILLTFLAAAATAFFSVSEGREVEDELLLLAESEQPVPPRRPKPLPVVTEAAVQEPRAIVLPPPPPIDRAKLKTKGCVADGLLNGYGDDENSSIAMINRSECYYLHRALETWLEAPDFEKALEIKDEITKPNTVYGMFLAEALDTKANYEDPVTEKEFDFSDMCRPGSKNFWGEHTCKPSLSSKEYQRYLESITETAMDIGVQVFMFGQVYLQDTNDLTESKMPKIIGKMREHAAMRGIDIMIGAQTGDIKDEEYLRQFDFIENGVGIDGNGDIESGPCDSRWYKEPGDWCWALLWHPTYAAKANNVFLHLDWSGKLGDDMSIFTRMSKERRAATLRKLHAYFVSREMAFFLPVMARLHRDNGGCYGGDKHFYSASRKYTCQDEDVINEILRGK
jgi:hypothetical protein